MLRPLRMILLPPALPFADQMRIETVGRLKELVETGNPE